MQLMWLSFVSLILVSSVIDSCWSANCRQLPTYQPIPPAQYDRTPASAGDLSKNPLGYYSNYIPSIEDTGAAYPCVTVTAPAGYMIEIMMESIVSGARLCAVDNSADPITICDSGLIRYCDAVPTNNPTYRFFCDDSCETSDVSFFYRFYVQNITELVQDPQDWCQDRDASEFPSSLFVPPTNVIVPNQPNDRRGLYDAAVMPSSCLFVIVASLLALMFTLL